MVRVKLVEFVYFKTVKKIKEIRIQITAGQNSHTPLRLFIVYCNGEKKKILILFW